MGDHDDLALKIDDATDNSDAGALKAALEEIEDRIERADPLSVTELHYFRANAFAELRRLHDDPFAWQQPNASEEILSLRRARKSEAFDLLNIERRAQILTNLGNALNTIGRPIEAIAAWDEALALIPSFAMAAGNRGYGLTTYSSAFYDPGHQCIFLSEAKASYRSALAPDAFWDSGFQPHVADQFAAKLGEISEYLARNCQLEEFDPFAFELGHTAEEARFSQWRLDNRLFLNPLNDLGAWPIAAQDVFHLPSHTYAFDEKHPRFVKFFDLLKQEYAAACVLLWEGRNVAFDEVHAADRSSLMFEHFDFSVSSIGHEKQKAALRLAYSLLDKSAVFINDFFKIGKEPKHISFRNVWFSDRNCKTLHPNLPETNWRLRGLYALSLDIYDRDLKEFASPLAAKANDVRNAAEHRFLSIHEFQVPHDRLELCDYVTEQELYQLSLHVLRLARSALMGLSLAIHHHERFRAKDEGGITVPIVSLPRRRFEDDDAV
ncbi:LA2681 family HEPN domain-containing protein [Phaeobacter sp. B1627]|uniref:LA2681 family HEPN domain-containing protein n=1 Tax=Phaeobacter sp. B1627 TaxID=2583809 RepID=UPI001118A889|nr:LA2681 family HEPN domain-containing protein [Phaeobacter sp. B1627]TNJ38971.1 hypothetical protein FGE21_19300 [Phaeobacter sp. B1627]